MEDLSFYCTHIKSLAKGLFHRQTIIADFARE